ncbi:11500_t:CDS:2 [Racocetra persica]|uniref:11500_t:CDS:1 n=1 Tax=Racocetra persica TaxID=160502 RepID=A0ACA9N7Z1_9GLOM|nr:11500_t:CDS:2 [Racocetra persica]
MVNEEDWLKIKDFIDGEINPGLKENLTKMCDASSSLAEFEISLKEYTKLMVVGWELGCK